MKKLKEINATLSNVLKEMETYIFVENICDIKEIKSKEVFPKALIELK